MGHFWYTLPIPQSVPRKLLLHNGFGLVGHLGHFEMASRENKSLQAAAFAPPAFRPLSAATRLVVGGLVVSCFGLVSTAIYTQLRLSTPKSSVTG